MKHLYVKKPIPVEAYQWDGSVDFRPADGFSPNIDQCPECKELETLEGWMILKPRCFILKGPKGEYWAVQEQIFLDTYEAVPQENGKKTYEKRCNKFLAARLQPYNRTCEVCKLGPCTFQ